MPSTKSATLRLGYNPDFAPFAWMEQEKARGELIDICEQILANTEWVAEYIPVNMFEAEEVLTSGEVDAVLGMAISEDRKSIFQFSRPLLVTGGAWFCLAETVWPGDEQLGFGNHPDLSVATPAKGPLAGQIARLYPNVELKTCGDYQGALAMVLDGKVDAAALNFQVGSEMSERLYPGRFKQPEIPFLRVSLALASLPDTAAKLPYSLFFVIQENIDYIFPT